VPDFSIQTEDLICCNGQSLDMAIEPEFSFQY
jgi:hypothetical protein